MNPRLLLVSLGAFCACSSTPLGGVRVTVRFLDTDAQCAKVFLSNPSGFVRVGSPVKRGTRDKIVGVAQDEFTGGAVDLQAKGYLKDDCSGDPIDFSKVERRAFVSGDRSADVLLVLRGGMTPDAGGGAGGGSGGGGGAGGGGAGGGMNDGGGGTGTDGGPDAGPSPEQCGNGIDDDFDGKIDCFDPDCVPLGDCNFGRRCTMLGVCAVPPKEMSCNDGLDDDNDTLIDCADDDCNLKSCADALMCTFGETCQNKLCTPATTLTCASPNECQVGAGTCLADAGCGYPARSNGTACDGGSCANGECQLQVPFTPSNGVPTTLPGPQVVGPITLDCGVSTFDSDTLVFGNWCAGQPKPTPKVLTRFGVQNLMVLPMAGLDLKGELRLTGSLPIALLVFGDASITGRLDVSGRHELTGAGGPASNCPLMGEPITPLVFSAGGGGGAGFAQAGTNGGIGFSNAFSAGLGGGTFAMTPVMQLRGGCSGSDGASGQAGQVAAKGGGAGGAVQLTVTGTLVVDGRVMANGGGGRGGTTFNAGGGGAGSGGGLLLEANLLDLRGGAKITAHGGGGGGGARDADDGTDGEDGHGDDANAAQGGNKGGGQAGDGANGGSTAAPGVAGNGSTSAGGGGGGGVGRIHLRSIAACQTAGGRLVSPAPTGNCP